MGLFKRLFGKKEVKLEKDNETSLVDFSVDYNIPILVGSQERINALKEINTNVDTIGFAKNFTKLVASLDLPNGVIVDNSVDPEMVEYLKTELSHIKIVE